jgi:hypothetical protein
MIAIRKFATLVEAFRVWAADGTDTGAMAVQQGLTHLVGLFGAALTLPDASPDGDVPDHVSDDEWKRVFAACRRLPISNYGGVFDPLALPPESPDVCDLADDLADIYRDVVNGLRAFQNGEAEAAWQWKFTFWSHWGRHAASAITALQAWLEAEGTGW